MTDPTVSPTHPPPPSAPVPPDSAACRHLPAPGIIQQHSRSLMDPLGLITPTASVAQAGQALGLQAAAVRQRLRDGRLIGVRDGRGYRITVASINALLAPPSPPVQPVPPVPQEAAPPPDPLAVLLFGPAAFAPPPPPPPSAPPGTAASTTAPAFPPPPAYQFDESDRRWIAKYRNDLKSTDPELRRDARWHLGQFQRRAAENEAWKNPKTWPINPI